MIIEKTKEGTPIAKAIVVYESKYGNTKLVAETIVEGINQVSRIKATLAELNDVDPTQIDEFDAPLRCGTTRSGPTGGGVGREQHQKIIDCTVLKMRHHALEQAIRQEQPDMVGATTLTPFFYDAVQVAEIAKEVGPVL